MSIVVSHHVHLIKSKRILLKLLSWKARKNGCDFIVALGGGSVMDASKAMAMMATNDGDLWDYISGGTGKGLPLKNEPLPVVCITTTAGTGSEADQWGVVTNEETNEKMGVGCTIRCFRCSQLLTLS